MVQILILIYYLFKQQKLYIMSHITQRIDEAEKKYAVKGKDIFGDSTNYVVSSLNVENLSPSIAEVTIEEDKIVVKPLTKGFVQVRLTAFADDVDTIQITNDVNEGIEITAGKAVSLYFEII
jgi:hypothetical protein